MQLKKTIREELILTREETISFLKEIVNYECIDNLFMIMKFSDNIDVILKEGENKKITLNIKKEDLENFLKQKYNLDVGNLILIYNSYIDNFSFIFEKASE